MNWWNTLTEMQKIYATIAIPATLVMIIQFILLLLGFGEGDGADMGDGAEMADTPDMADGPDLADIDSIDTEFDDGTDQNMDISEDHISGLRLLTLRGIIAFFSIGGWMGVVAIDWNLPVVLSIILALSAGWLALFFVAWSIRFFLRLQQSGNVKVENAVGKEGEVYLSIPSDGHGKVSVIVQDRLREIEAVTDAGRLLKTGEKIVVLGVNSDGVLLVTPKTSPEKGEITAN